MLAPRPRPGGRIGEASRRNALGVARAPSVDAGLCNEWYRGPEIAEPVVLTPEARRVVEEALDKVIASHRMEGIVVDTSLDEAFDVAESIMARALAMHADIIIMGTHGRSGLQRFLVGSVAEKVLREAECPVLIVPPRAPEADPPARMPFTRILCALDFSASALRAAEYAVSLAVESGGRVMVLHVVEVPDNYSDLSFVDLPAYERACCDESRRVLDRIITPAMRESCRVEALIASGKPYQEILHVATENAADLIVLGVQGRSLTDRLLFGSTAQHVVRQATCPVLTVRAA